jgi:hypothetical protein
MAALLNRARMSTATTGTGTVTLGSAVSGYATFAEASAVDATVYSYCIEDGSDFEIGVGTYTSAGTTFSRDTVTASKISGTAGTSKINLSGTAEIFITLRVGDLGTAAAKNTGTSGSNVPLMDGANTWSAAQTIAISTSTPVILQTNEDGASVGPAVKLFRNSTSPAAADVIGAFEFDGMDSAAVQTTYGRWQGVILDPTAGSRDSELQCATRVANAFATRLSIAAGLYHPSATGGDKGNNTINFGAVYDDNTLLTDYVFDKWLGRHEEYSPRVQAKYDELDPSMFRIDAHVAYMRENRRLYGMPELDDCIDGIVKEKSLGEMVQLLWQSLELANIHIAELHGRVKSLEASK